MYKDIFKNRKRLPGKFIVLLNVLGGLVVITFFIVLTVNWWQRAIVIVHISEFSLLTEARELNLEEEINNPDLPVSVPKMQGSLSIKIRNIGRSPAREISLDFLSQGCKLGKLKIYKTDPDCVIIIKPSTHIGLNPDFISEVIDPQDVKYFISVKELRAGSEVQLKYIVYKEGEGGPLFKFGKISSSNAKVKAFYYRQ